jgi:hypothetical protein
MSPRAWLLERRGGHESTWVRPEAVLRTEPRLNLYGSLVKGA